MPQLFCEIAFTKDTADGSPLWTDVTQYVQWWNGVRISRRRSHELDEVQPGTLALALDNTDGRFTAGRAASPYYPNVKLNRMIRIRAKWPGGVNLLLSGQAKGSDISLFSGSQGSLVVDTGVFPAGQTTSIRWIAGTLSNGTFLRIGTKSIASPTDEAYNVTAGVTYSIQCQARRDASFAATMALRVRWYDKNGAQISDTTGTGVTLTTSFQVITYSPTAPAGAVWARIVLVSTASTGGAVVIYTGAWQFEQAASPTAWVDPGQQYIRFTGFVDKWPHSWSNGVLGVVQISATDRQKLLSRDKLRGALAEEILSASPVFYYPLGEPEDATSAGNLAIVNQPDLITQTTGIAVEDALTFETKGGPDASTGVMLNPATTTDGKLLGVPMLYTALGGTAGMSLAAWVNFITPWSIDSRIIYADDGSDTTHVRVNYNPSSDTLTVGVRTASGSYVSTTTSFNLENSLHLVVVTLQLTGGNILIKAYVDGTLAINTTNATPVTVWPSLPRVRVGGLPGTALDPPQLMKGLLASVAGWNTVLSAAQVTNMYGARTAFAGELSGARAGRIATWSGVTRTAFDVGSSQMDRHPSTEQSPLAAFKMVAKSEGGIFFISGDDTATMHGRSRRQLPSTPTFTLTADQCGDDLNFTMDDQLLINDLQVSRSGKTVTRAINQASISANEGSYTASIDTLLYTDSEAIDRANYTLSTYGTPQPRAGQIRVDAHFIGTVWPQMLASEIGQRLQVTSLPSEAPASSLDLWCEGVAESITDQTWSFTFDTSPVRNTSLFILDDPVYGTLDANYLGW
ncbi:LamG domain-containing protein [Planotetraspora sp. A-T 1434]|uniref:LamG domain-containing protein n=1 Tax=Planotetraspora sp. A-T 1434 TaxID=2979219 RepID=UPI0021BF74E5|nr:LamG domain-containing protein [Planotetraspora sp. A-T 1434]MCT9932455.1 LamG domain-containing protein [Planotetraspora sp. A-T 1434]